MTQRAPFICLGDDTEVELPFKYVICSVCEGHGKSSAYLGAYTKSEMDEAGDEFYEDYMAGRYDKPCEHCDDGKAKVADLSRMTKQERKLYREQCEEEREYRAMCRAERAMGA